MSKRVFFLLAAMLSMITVNLQAATITASTDRSPVGLNESFMLIFESDGTVDDEPDFSPLNKDFQVLSRSSSSNMSIVNGKISTTKTWQLTVLARRAGKLIIPAISFGKDQSQPSFVNVTSGKSPAQASQASRDIFLEVFAEPESPYVQAQVIYTVRLFLAVATSNASLSEPGISGANAVIERLGEDSNFQTTRRGKRYNVVERKYAIYPQVSGSMTIESVMFQGQTNRNAFSLFDPFGPQPKTIIERSDTIQLEVKPIPDSFSGSHWIPAQMLKLTESWSQDPPLFRVGEPLTRTLTLTASGQTASQLPELPAWVPGDFKQYPDQAVLNDNKNNDGIRAVRQEKIAIIPNKAGEYVLPGISLPWWNTRTDELEYVSLPEKRIQVTGMSGSSVNAPAPVLPDPQPADTGLEPEGLPDALDSLPGAAPPADSSWRNLCIVFACAWLLTLFLWWRARKKDRLPAEDREQRTLRVGQALKSIEQASKAGNARLVKDELLAWAALTWPESPPLSIGEMAKRCPEELATELNLVNMHLYSPGKDAWDGAAFWRVFNSAHTRAKTTTTDNKGELEPLYRL